MQAHLWDSGDAAQENFLEAGLRCCRHGDRVPVATEAGRDPENIDLLDWLSRQVNIHDGSILFVTDLVCY